jgi:hypothetical protein
MSPEELAGLDALLTRYQEALTRFYDAPSPENVQAVKTQCRVFELGGLDEALKAVRELRKLRGC